MRFFTLMLGVVTAALVASPARAQEAMALSLGCLGCHSRESNVASSKTGPAFPEVAARYAGNPLARTALLYTVLRGGRGNWTEESEGKPMPGYAPLLTEAEAAELVDWVLAR